MCRAEKNIEKLLEKAPRISEKKMPKITVNHGIQLFYYLLSIFTAVTQNHGNG